MISYKDTDSKEYNENDGGKHIDISVVVPVYGCPGALPELHKRLTSTLSKLVKEYEIILVDDCDKKNSWAEVAKLCEKDNHVKGFHLSRNFGQPHAITCGVDYCSGEWLVVMDCDLQDRPEAIADLYKKAMEGYDVVFALRKERKDSAITKAFSKMFHRLYEFLSGMSYESGKANFSIVNKKVIDNYKKIREHSRAYQMFIDWLGFRTTSIEITGDKRFEGKSSYSFMKKLKFAIANITSQSNKPLYLSAALGLFISFCAFIYIIVIIILAATGWYDVMGFPTIVASIYLMGGLILAAVGIVGIYLGNVFNETKNRPIYVVAESRNVEESYIPRQ